MNVPLSRAAAQRRVPPPAPVTRLAVQFSAPDAPRWREWLRASNGWQWIGAGSIECSTDAVRIRGRSRPWLPFAVYREHDFERRQLLGAMREGRSVELHLRSTQRGRQQLRLWLADEATAAELVRALPTEYTVESDVPTPRPAAAAQRGLVPVPLVLIAILASGLGGYALHDLRRPESPIPVAPQAARDAPPMAAGSSAADSAVRVFTADELAALQAYEAAREPLNERFRSAWYDLQTGALAREDFVRLLDASLIFDWKVLASDFRRRARNAPVEFAATSARLERACLQHVAGLGLYLYGLQAGDPTLVERSIAIMVEADRDVESLRRRAP